MSRKKTPEAEERTREELLAVAIRVFLRDGYEASSMKTIADEADCTTGKLYCNYSKKEDFLCAFAKKLVKVGYEVTENLVQDGDHPLMPYYFTVAMAIETCLINRNFQELYYVGYSGTDSAKTLIKAQMERITPVLIKCRKAIPEEELYIKLLMIGGMLRSLIGCDYFNIEMCYEEKIRYYGKASTMLLGLDEEEQNQILNCLLTRYEQIHEAAYNVIIRAFSGNL